MGKMYIVDEADHEVMYQAEQASYTPEVREIWSREYFIQQRSNLPSIGMAIDGVCIGGAYMDDGFIHISMLPEYHGKWSLVYAEVLAWAFSHADPIYASILENNKTCLRFSERSGWEMVGRYDEVVYYRSTRCLFERLVARRERLARAVANGAVRPQEAGSAEQNDTESNTTEPISG